MDILQVIEINGLTPNYLGKKYEFIDALRVCLTIMNFTRERTSTSMCIQFLAPLAVGQRAYVMVCCPSCVRPCVNFFFKHLL